MNSVDIVCRKSRHFSCDVVDAQLSFGCNQPLNDNKWHTLYIRRRANYLEAFVDNCTSGTHIIIIIMIVISWAIIIAITSQS